MEDLKTWLIKILLPSLVAISIKLAVTAKKDSVTWFSVITSFVTGIGSAYLFSEPVISSVPHGYIPLVIAIIAISGEKIGFWLVFKFNVEAILEDLVEKLRKK